MVKAWDIVPPNYDPLKHAHQAVDDTLLCVKWTLDTYSSLPRETRVRLEDMLEVYELESIDLKTNIELRERLGKDW